MVFGLDSKSETLTTEDVIGNQTRVSISFSRLPEVVKPKNELFLNDGLTELDGTDCVMLSGESAMGEYPVDATAMLAKIAAAIEPHRTFNPITGKLTSRRENDDVHLEDLIALSVETTLKRITPPTVIVPTRSGATARSITRFCLPVWITAFSRYEKTCRDLMFSYGVLPICEPEHPDDWKQWTRDWLRTIGEVGNLVVLTEGPSTKHPYRNNRMEILDLSRT